MKLYTEEEVKAMQDKFNDELKDKLCLEPNGTVYLPQSLEFSEEEEKKVNTGIFGFGAPKIVKGKRLIRVNFQTIRTPEGMVTYNTNFWQAEMLDDMYNERNKFRKMEHELTALGFKLEHTKKKTKS